MREVVRRNTKPAAQHRSRKGKEQSGAEIGLPGWESVPRSHVESKRIIELLLLVYLKVDIFCTLLLATEKELGWQTEEDGMRGANSDP